MTYKSDPAGIWKAVRTLEKGFKHYHVQNRTVQVRKANGKRTKTNEENAEVFAEHFRKVFSNPDLPLCNDTVLPIVPTWPEVSHLGDPPLPVKVRSAIMRMCNSKAPGPSGITSDAFCAMVFQRLDLVKTGINFWEGNPDIKSWCK
eukprot:1573277-Ditylum_brightwellii.AAC.1